MENEINQIEEDVKFYKELSRNVRIRYGDTVDMSALDSKMQQIVDTDVSSSQVSRITKQINITDKNELLSEVEQLEGEASRADAIESRLSQSINNNYGKDHAYYKKLSQLNQVQVNTYKEKRISEKDRKSVV